jgi:tryptophan synthase beta chain
MKQTKYLLSDQDIPKHYYNVIPDLPSAPPPPLDPDTNEAMDPAKLAVLFPMGLLEQEMSAVSEIEIPDEIRQAYSLYRPTPLVRARRLEKALGTPAHIYFKNEGASPTGSHKSNTAIAQAYYNIKQGVHHLITETGAGQWGSALSLAGSVFDIDVAVYMVKLSYQQKPYRRSMVQTYGARIYASPSERTQSGRNILAAAPDSPGSLGIAISEAVEEALHNDKAKYSLGSVLNHVLLHQTVIGLEAKKQMEMAGEYPDVVIACHGGGSNFAGISFPFLRDKAAGKTVRFLAAEPKSCPTLTKGEYKYDFGDTAGFTPLMKMYTLGHDFVPPSIHAGGLRYHGSAPLVSQLLNEELIEAVAYGQDEIFPAAVFFARTEGIIPAPESAHAIKAVMVEAEKARQEGKERVILFNLSGHGHFDMAAYDAYLSGNMNDNVK